MNLRYVSPTVSSSFNCPYADCAALAHQNWFKLYVKAYEDETMPFTSIRDDIDEYLDGNRDITGENREKLRRYAQKISSGKIFVFDDDNDVGYGRQLRNLDVSQCFSCKKFSVWKYGTLIFPTIRSEFRPNADLPDDVKRDYEEAAQILSLSPRGSAALLRLCVQKICKTLGEKGADINADIASLVKQGLDPRIQKALDVVRVVGNEAVHPGQIDLNDNLPIARKLFDIVNMIADAMISQPKAIDELYHSLPEAKKEAIRRRDA